MSKVERMYCNDCGENRPFVTPVLCSGIETVLWFLLGVFLWWPLLIVMVLRHIPWSANRSTCQQCGSGNSSCPVESQRSEK